MDHLKNRDAILLFLRRPVVEATNFRAQQTIVVEEIEAAVTMRALLDRVGDLR